MLSSEKRAPLSSISSNMANAYGRKGVENEVRSLDEKLFDELQEILIHNVCNVDVCQRGLEIVDSLRAAVTASATKSCSLRVDLSKAQKYRNSDDATVSSPSKIQRLESELAYVTVSEDEHAHSEEMGVMHWDATLYNEISPPNKPLLERDNSAPMQLGSIDDSTEDAAVDARTARRRRRASLGSSSNTSSGRYTRGRRKNQSKSDDMRDSPVFMSSPIAAESKQPAMSEATSYAQEKSSPVKLSVGDMCKDTESTLDRLSPPADIAMPLDEEEEDCGIVTFDIQSSPVATTRNPVPSSPPKNSSTVTAMFTFNSFSSARDILNNLYSASSNGANGVSPSMDSVPAVVFLLTLCLQIENNSAEVICAFALKYLTPWLQCLERLRSTEARPVEVNDLPPSGTPSKIKKKRRIKFKEVCAASASPPNDRLPNSHEEFEITSISMFQMLECVSTICKMCSEGEENRLLRQFTISLHVLSYRDNVASALRALELHSGMHIDEVRQVEVVDLAFLLHEELISRLKDASLSDIPSEPSLYTGGCVRSQLRHRSTWMMVAVMRYHLRWLLDEPPSRATTVVLTGKSPADSCRSELFTKVRMSPCNAFEGALDKLSFRPGNSVLAPFSELPPSTIFVQALQQYFEGINFVLKSTSTCRWNDVPSFFRVINDTSSRFSRFISETMTDLEAFDSADAKLLYTAQVTLFHGFLW